MDEIKKLIAEIQAAFEQFKAANDQRLKQIEAKGSADTVTEQKVDKINATITELQAKLAEATETAKRAEIAANTLPLNGSDARDEERVNARAFFAQVRGQSIEAINLQDADLEGYRNYRRGLLAYMRRGEQGLGSDLRNAMSVGSDPNGGYWVTPDMGGRMATLIRETSDVRRLASVQVISTDALEGPLDLDEANADWVAETASRSSTTTPTIGKYRIPVHEMYANPPTTQQLLDDAAVDVASWLEGKVASKMVRLENTAFVNGNGVGKPRGFLTYGSGTPSASSWNVIERVLSGSTSGFSSSDKLIDLVFALKAAYRANANWAMSRATVATVRKLKDGQNNYLWQPNFEQRQGGLLLGYPIAELEDMPAIASATLAIAFGDFRAAYQIVDRQGFRVLRDPFTNKPYVHFYTTRRVGGDVVNFEALKLMQFSVS